MDNFDFFDPNLPKNGFWGQNFENLSLHSQPAAFLRLYVHQFSDKTDNFEILGPNLPKNRFWAQNFKNLSLDLESAFLRYYVHQFSDKTDNFENMGSKFQKCRCGFRISILEILCAPIFKQNRQR